MISWQVSNVTVASTPDPSLSQDWGGDGQETNLSIYVSQGSVILTTTDGSPRKGGSGGQTTQRTISGPYTITGAVLRTAAITKDTGTPVVTVVASWPEVDDAQTMSEAGHRRNPNVSYNVSGLAGGSLLVGPPTNEVWTLLGFRIIGVNGDAISLTILRKVDATHSFSDSLAKGATISVGVLYTAGQGAGNDLQLPVITLLQGDQLSITDDTSNFMVSYEFQAEPA